MLSKVHSNKKKLPVCGPHTCKRFHTAKLQMRFCDAMHYTETFKLLTSDFQVHICLLQLFRVNNVIRLLYLLHFQLWMVPFQ